ncbi:MAG TPA: glycerate kinase, partial [Desulfuromonadales bacterium]|nr:glycerate kinase [Desulfuromonadales bacterium]
VGADLVITGEGCIDRQTISGKTPAGVGRIARRHGVPVIAFAGSLSPDADGVHHYGIDAVFSILSRPCSLEDALVEAGKNLRTTARNVAAVMKLARNGRI